MKTLKLLTLIFLLTFISACSSDDDSGETIEDIREQIENFVSPEILQTLEDFGFIFREGTDTPNISGEFTFSPSTLTATNVENDSPIGSSFADKIANISNIDNEDRTFDVDITDGGVVSDNIINTFFTGNGNEFNAYIQEQFTSGQSIAVVIRAISGVITPEGIEEAQTAVFLLSSSMPESDGLIEVGEGRLFKDYDGLAERTTEEDNSILDNANVLLKQNSSFSSQKVN